jgi:hypothetical protein
MARATIEVDRHTQEYRWEAHVEAHVLTGSVPVRGTGAPQAQAAAWAQAARAVSRLVAGFEGDR